MQKIILIKYGELSTKKYNKGFFVKTLCNNIKNILNDKAYIEFDFGRMIIIPKIDFKIVLDKLKKVFGIHEIIIAYRIVDRDLDSIKNSIILALKDKKFETFKVDVKRSDKSYPLDGMELRKELGSSILDNFNNIKVDVNNPELTITVEIRLEEVFIYFEKIKGLGGYPVGTSGKGLLMLSGGIDSPVSGYLATKRGVRLEAIYFESPPHTSEMAKKKVIDLAKVLSLYNGDVKLHVINFTEIQEEIYKNIPHEYLITIMRRMMYRISETIANKNNSKIIVNGESIGQVASQTLTSMNVINEVIKMPVIRPVACLDKLEIIDISKRIETYDISIRPFDDCCTIFVPVHPIINPDINKCHEFEKLINYEDMINKAVNNEEVLFISDDINNNYDDLL